MKKHTILTVAMSALLFTLSATASADLRNTGVDGSGVALNYGDADLHYSLTLPGGAAATAMAVQKHSNWVAPPADAQWIAPTPVGTDDAAGIYIFETTFEAQSTNGLSISGKWATDNSGEIWLNDQNTGITRAFGSVGDYGFQSLEPFEITSGFVAGVNTLQFRVQNGDQYLPHGIPAGPMGLPVTDMTMNVVPVPGAVLLGVLGLSVAGARLRKRT